MEFINKANELHGFKYDYSETQYKNMRSRIIVTCPIHGEFVVLASNHVRVFQREDKKHLKPCGCPKCGKESVKQRNLKGRKTAKIFAEEAKLVHGNKYDYSNVEYKRNNINVEIVCPTHGLFRQQPINHLRGNGCPRCKISKGERLIINRLDDLNIEYIREHTFHDCIGTAGMLKFDFFLPNENLLIEYDGEQHYRPVRFHRRMTEECAKNMFQRTQLHDSIKNQYALENNIELLRIPFNQQRCINDILTSATIRNRVFPVFSYNVLNTL